MISIVLGMGAFWNCDLEVVAGEDTARKGGPARAVNLSNCDAPQIEIIHYRIV